MKLRIGAGVIGVAGLLAGCGGLPPHNVDPGIGMSSSSGAPTPSLTSTAPATTKIIFEITGSAPQGVVISAGSPEGQQFTPTGTLGPNFLNAGVPWKVSTPFVPGDPYYVISVNLQGGNNSITCQILAVNTAGTTTVLATGTAAGSYTYCNAGIAPTDQDGSSWTPYNNGGG
jgi:hypothetical protein